MISKAKPTVLEGVPLTGFCVQFASAKAVVIPGKGRHRRAMEVLAQ
jgi:hypothetical protein